MRKSKHYLDTNVFISFINGNEKLSNDSAIIMQAAEENFIEVFTSHLTTAEYFYVKGNENDNLDHGDHEQIITQLFDKPWINYANWEREMSVVSRYLAREYELTFADSVHLATAIRLKVDFFDTTDERLIRKIPQKLGYLEIYPEIVIQTPKVPGFQPRIQGL